PRAGPGAPDAAAALLRGRPVTRLAGSHPLPWRPPHGPARGARRGEKMTLGTEHLMGDPVRVRQTLVNLVGNAVKFTDAGAIIVEARVLRRASSHVVVRVSVTDTGIGIPAERQAGLLASFAQAHDSP